MELFMEWKRDMKKNTERKIKVLRSDNGGEYTDDLFLQLCRDEGIEKNYSKGNTATKRGDWKDEHALLEKVRCVLSNTGLSKYF